MCAAPIAYGRVKDMTQSEDTLVEQARSGDKGALTRLVEEHLNPIYRVALRMCGNVSDAEETLQETFLSAIKALPQFEGRAQFSTWLYRIASNACFMQRRRNAAGPQLLSFEMEDDADAFTAPRLLTDWSEQPVDIALDHELHEQMQEAIAALPPALRIVFLWRDLEGLSTAETAEIVGISEAAVKVRLHRARLQLRESLSSYFAAHTSAPATPLYDTPAQDTDKG